MSWRGKESKETKDKAYLDYLPLLDLDHGDLVGVRWGMEINTRCEWVDGFEW